MIDTINEFKALLENKGKAEKFCHNVEEYFKKPEVREDLKSEVIERITSDIEVRLMELDDQLIFYDDVNELYDTMYFDSSNFRYAYIDVIDLFYDESYLDDSLLEYNYADVIVYRLLKETTPEDKEDMLSGIKQEEYSLSDALYEFEDYYTDQPVEYSDATAELTEFLNESIVKAIDKRFEKMKEEMKKENEELIKEYGDKINYLKKIIGDNFTIEYGKMLYWSNMPALIKSDNTFIWLCTTVNNTIYHSMGVTSYDNWDLGELKRFLDYNLELLSDWNKIPAF